MLSIAFAILFLLAGANSASATSTLDCAIDDANLSFDFQDHIGTAGDYRRTNLTSNPARTPLRLKLGAVPEALRARDLPMGLRHHWLAGRRLDLHFYGEFDAKGEDSEFMPGTVLSVELILRTETDGKLDEMTFRGRYDLTVGVSATADAAQRSWTLKGRARCVLG